MSLVIQFKSDYKYTNFKVILNESITFIIFYTFMLKKKNTYSIL